MTGDAPRVPSTVRDVAVQSARAAGGPLLGGA